MTHLRRRRAPLPLGGAGTGRLVGGGVSPASSRQAWPRTPVVRLVASTVRLPPTLAHSAPPRRCAGPVRRPARRRYVGAWSPALGATAPRRWPWRPQKARLPRCPPCAWGKMTHCATSGYTAGMVPRVWSQPRKISGIAVAHRGAVVSPRSPKHSAMLLPSPNIPQTHFSPKTFPKLFLRIFAHRCNNSLAFIGVWLYEC